MHLDVDSDFFMFMNFQTFELKSLVDRESSRIFSNV